ncbi:MAG: LysM peptidoglycan-binding domain-containing protein [Thermaceae bacterium]|nr:LysM peptidoglycan-binding domain-containing protein [Thermaceae bacterium]
MRRIGVLPWLMLLALAQAPNTYTVQPKDTLFSIAKRFGTSVELLLQLNNLSSPSLEVGQVLRLPTPTVTYTVQPKDTLFSIAKKNNSTVEAIMQENNLQGPALRVGQVLRIPQGASTPSSPPSPAPSPSQATSPPSPPTPVPTLTPITPLPNPTPPEPPKPADLAPLPANPPRAEPADTDYDPTNPLIQVVLKYLGLPYVYGSSSDLAVDCSAFVQKIYADLGIKIPRTSRDQWANLTTVQGALHQGDLVFFSFGGSQVDHVGIYLGRGVFAHANSYGSRVVIESLDSPYYKKVYRGAKRVESSSAGTPASP